MSKIEYITTRELRNSLGKVTGKFRVLKLKGKTKAEVEYTCPECKFSERKEEVWEKPFSFNCSKCGFLIRVPSLRAEIKKMKRLK